MFRTTIADKASASQVETSYRFVEHTRLPRRSPIEANARSGRTLSTFPKTSTAGRLVDGSETRQ